MKKIIFKILAALLALTFALALASCNNQEKEQEQEVKRVDFSLLSDEELAKCATLGEYKGLEIKLDGRSKSDAVWSAVRSGSVLGEISQQQIDYYLAQEKARYSHYADKAGLSYDEMLAELGVTQSDIMKAAVEMTTDDIIFELVRRDAKIKLMEDEKHMFFDRYVKKYVDDFGYTEEYVKNNMADIVYSSMLYDKTTEFLIANNSFID